MKKILSLFALLCSLTARSQDSVKVTIQVQARDVYFISAGIWNDYASGELFDSIKLKVRIPSPPNGVTTVPITGYTMDWLNLLKDLRNNPLALKRQHAERVNDLLRAVNQPYLTSKIDSLDAVDLNADGNAIQFGKNKSRRQ